MEKIGFVNNQEDLKSCWLHQIIHSDTQLK